MKEKSRTTYFWLPFAVTGIPNDRMSRGCKMNTYLMSSPRDRLNFEQNKSLVLSQDFKMGFGRSRFFCFDRHSFPVFHMSSHSPADGSFQFACNLLFTYENGFPNQYQRHRKGFLRMNALKTLEDLIVGRNIDIELPIPKQILILEVGHQDLDIVTHWAALRREEGRPHNPFSWFRYAFVDLRC